MIISEMIFLPKEDRKITNYLSGKIPFIRHWALNFFIFKKIP